MDITKSRGAEWRKWDLHLHSTASDGKASPQEIIQKAVEQDLSVIALTDHHTVKNLDEIKKEGEKKGVKVISGVEFRTEYGEKSVHMIGLFPDFNNGLELTQKVIEENILHPLGLSETAIIFKGRQEKSDKELTDEQAFKKGMFLVQVNFKEASDLIRIHGGVVSVHAGSKSNSLDEEMKHKGSAKKKC